MSLIGRCPSSRSFKYIGELDPFTLLHIILVRQVQLTRLGGILVRPRATDTVLLADILECVVWSSLGTRLSSVGCIAGVGRRITGVANCVHIWL